MKKERSQVIDELREMAINSLNLHYLEKGAITAETSLMEGGLGLDSIDILELVVGIEQKYGVKIKNAEQGREIFETFGSIADFILSSDLPTLKIEDDQKDSSTTG